MTQPNKRCLIYLLRRDIKILVTLGARKTFNCGIRNRAFKEAVAINDLELNAKNIVFANNYTEEDGLNRIDSILNSPNVTAILAPMTV